MCLVVVADRFMDRKHLQLRRGVRAQHERPDQLFSRQAMTVPLLAASSTVVTPTGSTSVT